MDIPPERQVATVASQKAVSNKRAVSDSAWSHDTALSLFFQGDAGFSNDKFMFPGIGF